MPKIHVNKSIELNVPVDKVYKIVNDFNHWNAWSPWIIMEPETKLDIAEGGKYYSWDGKRIGTGNMTITNEKENEWVEYDLVFLTPWKSKAKVRFEMKSLGENKTQVNWIMDSSLPFFMFFMKKMMTGFIGMDFQRGLFLLKDYAEDGKVHSKMDFKGKNSYDGCSYVGIKRQCGMDELSEKMSADFTQLHSYAEKNKDNLSGVPFSMYHKWDMANGKVTYTSGIPVEDNSGELPDGMIKGEIPQTPVYTVKHTGPYQHLGNAWSTLMNMKQAKTFKQNKAIHPFETYVTEPGKVPENELVTEVHFPVK